MRLMLFVLLLIFSCKDDYQKELHTIAFHKSDSLFAANSEFYKNEADSFCNKMKEDKFQFIIDSIIEIRREQVKQLRKLE
ncbi:MAG: hypothetical protein ABIO44_09250 [Saprospiraceae bacterium]